MKRFIRACIAFAACAAMLLNTVAMAISFKDVTDTTQYKDSIATLTTIGLIKGYEDGTFRPENKITRAEFTTIVVRALAMEDKQTSEQTIPFEDLLGHYARFNVKTAYDMGIINGFEDGSFRPDENVTYEQAMKMVVCMLGYGEAAAAFGGYPEGYFSVGSQLGLTKEITVPRDQPASRAVIVKLIDNALEVPMQIPVPNMMGGVKYVSSNETILKDKLRVERVKALVTAVGDTEISEGDEDLKSYEMRVARTTDDTEILLDFSGLFKDYNEAKNYLGHIIYAYYKDVDDEESDSELLLAIDNEIESNREISIESRAIENYRNSTLYYLVTQDKSDSMKLRFDEMSIVYNGKVAKKTDYVEVDGDEMTVADAMNEWLDPDSENFFNGELKLVDSDGDGIADVMFIMNYSVMVAAAIPTSTDYTIKDKLVPGESIMLHPDDDSYEYTITRNGSPISVVTSIRANDVVLVAKSIDEEYITLNVTGKPVNGAITDIDGDIITINGNEYEITDACRDHLDGDDEIKVGTEGTFYIDCYNNVWYATINTSNSSYVYAYLINIVENDETGSYYATVYAPTVSSNSTTRYNVADKVEFNGSSMSVDKVVSKLEDSAWYSRADLDNQDRVYASADEEPKANDYTQLIKYSLKKNEIAEIITLSEPEIDESTGRGEYNSDSEEIIQYAPLSKYTYSSTNNFSNIFQINSSTLIMYVPGNRSSRSDYHKYTASGIFKVNQSYWVEAYDVNSSKIASLVIVYGNSSLADITKDTVMSVVAKSPTEVDVSDDVVTKLTLYNSSTAMTTKNAADNKEFADLEPGDVIQFGQNNNSRIINRKDIVRAADVRDVIEAEDGYDWTDSRFEVSFINDEGNIEIDTESGAPYSRAFVANVVEVIHDEEASYIRVTRDGFDDDGNIISDNDERYEIAEKTPIIRFNVDDEKVSAYVDGTTTKLTIDNLRDAKYSGEDCSKLFIYTVKGEIKFIMVYETK